MEKRIIYMLVLLVTAFFLNIYNISASSIVILNGGGGTSFDTSHGGGGTSFDTSHSGGGTSSDTKVSCGSVKDIPAAVPQLTKVFFDVMKMAVPIVLVIKGIIDLLKSSMAQKEDEIKKGQQTFIKRIVAAALFFVVVLITQFVFSVIGTTSEANTVANCINCFMNNHCR